MSFLIDLTDERFKIPANQAVIDYIRRENPFAHSDIGAELIRSAKLVPDAQYYCPSFSSLAYVALHTKANIVFAIRPFPRCEPRAVVDARLNRWCEAAFRYAQALAGDAS